MTVPPEVEHVVARRAVEDLRRAIHGRVVTRNDHDYERARSIWNAHHDRSPALVVYCADVDDVELALEFARGEGLPVAIRGGGHSVPGFSRRDGGIVIDLSPLRGITRPM
jgi:FAD/FMN-containing dehydrogenase